MKKIAILTLFHNNYNWGGVLQGYALRRKITEFYANINEDVTVDILKYSSSYNPVYPSLLRQMTQYTLMEIMKKTSHRLVSKNARYIGTNLEKRKKLFEEFISSNTTNTTLYNDNNLKTIKNEYLSVISGSDQVWNPNVARLGFFQDMVTKPCRKIAYSASIARDNLSGHERDVIIPMVEKFDFISVREKTAKQLLDKYMGNEREIYETLDPALLLTVEQWEENLPMRTIEEERYAFAFFFSESYSYRVYIEKICKKKNIKLKFIPFAKQEYISSDLKGECERVFDVGPIEFLQLFQNADYVFTDSFHGAVFSILFHKHFYVFERDGKTKVSKNSRLYDLLEKFNLQRQLIQNVEILEERIEQKVDYEQVELILEDQRNYSETYLKKALGIG